MKTCSTHSLGNVVRWTSFLGAILSAALMTPSVAASQSPPVVTAVENGGGSHEFALFQNNPNPFNPSTMIQYSLEKPVHVSLKVYNLLGNKVASLVDSPQEVGSYTVTFNSNKGTLSLASGVYFYRLEAGSFVSTKKLVIMK